MKLKGFFIGMCAADIILIALAAYLFMQVDRTAPEITFAEEKITYRNNMKQEELLKDVTAYDNEDGDVTDTLVIEKISSTAKGDVIVTYAALDRSNNVAKKSRVLPAMD